MNLAPTRPTLLVALAIFAGSFGWAVAHLWSNWFDTQMPIPWLTAVMMWILTISLFVWTMNLRSRLNPKPGQPRVHPITAARSAALALASSRAGSLVFGFYLGILIVSFSDAGSFIFTNLPATTARDRIIISFLVIVASFLFVVVALWLERICRLPKPPVDEKQIAHPA